MINKWTPSEEKGPHTSPMKTGQPSYNQKCPKGPFSNAAPKQNFWFSSRWQGISRYCLLVNNIRKQIFYFTKYN